MSSVLSRRKKSGGKYFLTEKKRVAQRALREPRWFPEPLFGGVTQGFPCRRRLVEGLEKKPSSRLSFGIDPLKFLGGETRGIGTEDWLPSGGGEYRDQNSWEGGHICKNTLNERDSGRPSKGPVGGAYPVGKRRGLLENYEEGKFFKETNNNPRPSSGKLGLGGQRERSRKRGFARIRCNIRRF